MAELVLRLREREMARVGIIKTSMTVGRDNTCDLVIDNAAVSRTHATVTFSEGAYRVRDEDSENGITLNGRRVRKAALDYGDVIGIGKFEIELVDSYHEPMHQVVAGQPKDNSKNVMKTMQVDSTTAARLRDEAMARIAASKGLPAPVPKAPPRAGTPQVSQRAPAVAPSPVLQSAPVARTGPTTVQLIALVAVALIAGVVLTLLITK
jgi:predicted component of type VI protein secretion system